MNEKLLNGLKKLGIEDIEKLPGKVKRKIAEFDTELNKKSAVAWNYRVDPPVRTEKSKQRLADLYDDIIEGASIWLDEQEDVTPPPPPPATTSKPNEDGNGAEPEEKPKKKGFFAWLAE